MRSFGAAALFTIAIITECLGAHSDRSRSRSGPVRNAPVAASAKKDVNFDCPEEFGYYPHPTDCTLYYVCVFGGALLESCTGGLMYSHELQTCDWPRNVGCDVTSAGGEELERVPEQRLRNQPPPPPPRRTPPPPLPRAQPNPVVTSRGQPKFSRQEYEKQQQLYEEVDDLPPVEEIENDRQQRVYRGQPATIGQVQKDRDGYGIQQVSSGRALNSNIIPASIPQNSGKIGSFSFGSQVDDRRTATVTPAPQSYSEDKRDTLTDSLHDLYKDVETNEISTNDMTEKPVLRMKRDLIGKDLEINETRPLKTEDIDKRNDNSEEMEYVEYQIEHEEGLPQNDTERDKRQIRYYLKNGYNPHGKNWAYVKPVNIVEYPQSVHNLNQPNSRYYHEDSNKQNKDSYNEAFRHSHSPSNTNLKTGTNLFLLYQQNAKERVPFKLTLPDSTSQTLSHIPLNSASQIITKSPPISTLNNDQFTSLAGGFYNNAPRQNVQFLNQASQLISRNPVTYPDSSHVPSMVVTTKPVLLSTLPRPQEIIYKRPGEIRNQNYLSQKNQQPVRELVEKRLPQDKEYEESDNSTEEEGDESYEEDEGEDEEDESHKHNFKPPYEFTHPSNKYKEIINPFANPNFDFDAYLSKLSNGQYMSVKPNLVTKQAQFNNPNLQISTVSTLNSNRFNSGISSSTVGYDGTVLPGPGSSVASFMSSIRPSLGFVKQEHTQEQSIQRPESSRHTQLQQLSQSSLNTNRHQPVGISVNDVRLKLKPPNFEDDRQLPISYSFNRPIINSSPRPHQDNDHRGDPSKGHSGTPKPYIVITGTDSPIILSTPKQNYMVKPENLVSQKQVSSIRPYLVSSIKPHDILIALKQSTPKPLTTIANEQLSALQQYWNKNPTTESLPTHSANFQSSTPVNIQKLENLFAQVIKTTPTPVSRNNSMHLRNNFITTTKPPLPKRKLIPKPSPEMNDYYYDDDDDKYYYEPIVKPKYMPSTEVRPQRPILAQNDKEYYEDTYEDDSDQGNTKQQSPRIPTKYNTFRLETATKNHNDVSVLTKSPLKIFNKNPSGNVPIPVLVDFDNTTPNTLIRPEISNYHVIHHMPRNNTMHIKKPTTVKVGPNTVKPPKYLNQTTLRPYTVRHRLAKPTTMKESSDNEDKHTRGRIRHPNIVAQMKVTTPRDSHNQETRYTKVRHDDKSNSLEPTESVAPVSYSPSPRPKMLYNGSQNYSPDQYDPFYAVYDEDGELYKDTDYVHQYNTASLRPAVQQTYRGTPPPSRRPVETYTPRPSADDYDDELIQPQINNQNQYQAPVRHSTRGEGNELGYDHSPSSVKTTLYEAITISTTPPTTSTSTTTQRSTTAPYTEAKTLSRHTQRLSTDENPLPESSSPPSDKSLSVPSTLSSIINFSSLAKPFEKTDNSHRLEETLTTTEKILTTSRNFSEETNPIDDIEVVGAKSNSSNKKTVSLTSGFSIRRNLNNTNNPYTLTVLSRPIDDYEKESRKNKYSDNRNQVQSERYYYDTGSISRDTSVLPVVELDETPHNSATRRNDFSLDNEDNDDIPVYVRPTSISRPVKSRIRSTTLASTTSTKTYSNTERTILTSPRQFLSSYPDVIDKTENSIKTETIAKSDIKKGHVDALLHLQLNSKINEPYTTRGFNRLQNAWNEPPVSPYKTLDNLRNILKNDMHQNYTTTPTTISTTQHIQHTTTARIRNRQRNPNKQKYARTKPTYYSYRIEDEIIPDHTTEILNGKVKNVIKAFLNNFVSSSEPEFTQELTTETKTTSTSKSIPLQRDEEKVINIGFTKKTSKYVGEKPLRSNINRLQVITEPTENQYISPMATEAISFVENENVLKGFSSTSTPIKTTSNIPFEYGDEVTAPMSIQSSTSNYRNIPIRDLYQSKFSSLITSTPASEGSYKFHKLINDRVPQSNHELINLHKQINKPEALVEDIINTTTAEIIKPSKMETDIASTTSTTKATTTIKIQPMTSTIKSISFPTRASRVNPAIKLAATNPGGGRRSYQSSSKCSSDDSLQENPKCNEIKYQRPTNTRGRGSAHYSSAAGSDPQSQPAPNRGTPPTRNRPTLKPSTAIVSKSIEYSDIYAYPPSRPAPVYPQPTPDKTAAKCRKDVCLLPDCYCGGKDIPGDIPLDQVPQIVLLTFDDSVNDLNKGLYADLFEKGRVNPNGCPISATFYVSHEWTDYSQVQNLYAAGHEMASHTISHSFGEQFSQKKWYREVGGQREILAAYGGVKLEDVRGMRAPFLSVGGNKMFKMLYDSNFTYDSSLPVYENKPPSWPYTLDYKLFHDCMIPPCPTKSYPGVWEVPMVMWQDLNGGRCSMGDACANPPEAENVYKMILKNFDRHYTSNRAPFGLFYHAAWFTQPHHKEGFIMFLDFINQMPDVWIVTNWQALQWVRDPTPISRLNNFQPFQCNYQDRPKKCNNPKVCNLWHKSGVRYMRTCQPCPEVYPWTGKSGIRSSRIDKDNGE